MRNTIWNKRIPTLLSIILIVVSIAITSLLVKSGVIFISKAGPSQIPQNIRVVNVGDTSLTINYTTEDSVIGSINFGKDKTLGQNGLDERDKSTNSVAPHKIHSITITNLNFSTNYFFSITSGQNTFLNNGELFQTSTGSIIQATPSSQMPIAGNVILPNGNKPSEAIVYATVDGAQTISTLVKPDGSYMLPLNSLKKGDFSSYFDFDKNLIIKMLIVGDSLKSNVLLSKDQINPVPTVTLSKDYDFTVGQEPVASQSAQIPSFPSVSIAPSEKETPQIATPKKDEGFSDQQPLFKGTAQPNQTIKIIIHSSDNIQTDVTTDSYGNWSYRPQTPLSPGKHTISIATKDAFGILKTITQSFIVYASGTQIAGALPSGIPTPSLSSTLPSSPSPTLTPTPTLIPTSTPIPTPTPTIALIRQNIPPSGNSEAFVIGIIGLALSTLGILLFFGTRGSISF